ncbi:MAG: S-layer family protein, partial [Rivularia sp. ALOHA_DT_140]|nr:S-layer family protein [Rivularia sp. ALOHA_DT_140]
NASGTGSGTIQIHGGNLTVKDGSVVWLENRGQQAAGSININIANSIDLVGSVPDGQIRSGVYSDVSTTGKGGNLTVNSTQIKLVEGGNLQTRTFGYGDSGNVTVNASNIEFIDTKADFITGVIGTRSFGSFGNSGDITVNTQSISINGGGAITAGNASVSGNSGNVMINASDFVKLSVFASNGGDAIIGASAISSRGNAGNITINTPRLLLEGGALISSSTFGAGNSGTITVNASDSVSLSGTHFSPTRGILEGSAIRTAGVLLPSSISSLFGLPNQVTGSAGNVIINTPKLSITDGAEVFVRHDSVGNAGKLQIDADLIVLDGEGSLSASTKSGEGGNIDIQSDFLNLRNQSQITATAGGIGNGGNITINSPVIAGFENSDIIANAVEGNGGNIDITTQGIFGLKFRDRVSFESDITASSQFGVNGSVKINNVNIDPSSGLTELPIKLSDSSQQISQGCSSGSDNSFIATGRGGIPQNPSQYLYSYQTWSDIRNLLVSPKRNNHTVENIPKLDKTTIVEATGFRRNKNGEIELVALENNPFINKHVSDCGGINT